MMIEMQSRSIPSAIVCPNCRGQLEKSSGHLLCRGCGLEFSRDEHGYIDFTLSGEAHEKSSTTEEHSLNQSSEGANRLDDEFIVPYVDREPGGRILDVGCGIGRTVSKLVARGREAYGVDLPCLSGFWAELRRDPERFFCADASALPFTNDYFDTVISLGVIEHIGTRLGHCTLEDDYLTKRQRYADELLRVVKPGGRILIACPNKSFPLDPQHEVTDDFSRDAFSVKIRDALCERTRLNIHKVWGKYHLLSYGEVRSLFCSGNGNLFEPQPVKGYFALDLFKSGFLKPFGRLADLYINHMPGLLTATPLNPYLIVQIRKKP